ncbi:MAG: tetratricopeptide repeat protein [Acidobacteriota bacterium]|nr:tetratricopeptide repeat protein [Acidobacteriota bacterium]
MSQSPDNSLPTASYTSGWAQINEFLREGRNWSGNERNVVLLNTGSERFADISAVSGLDFVDDARGQASVDWDQDGDLDFWLRNRTAPRVRLMLNRGEHGPSVALRLRGVTSNRDGIGARIEIEFADASSPALVRYLTAGDGFRSQSSKWVHFGLSSTPEIDSVVVDWPGGEQERFDGVQAGGRFLLEQGRGTAQAVAPRTVTPDLPSSPRPVGSQIPNRTVLSRRFPMTAVDVRSLEPDAAIAVPTQGHPTLLNLWASWCSPCIEELQTLRDAHDRLSTAGLEIVAATVEGLDPESPTTLDDARGRVAELRLPFVSAEADSNLLDRLAELERLQFARVRELAVPTSYLFDERGRLAVIYRGKVEAETLIADLDLLSIEGAELLPRALPYPGRSLNPYLPVEVFLPGMAESRIASDPEAAIALLESTIAYQTGRRTSGRLNEPQTRRLNEELAHNRVTLGRALASAGRAREAVESYQAALRIDPRQADAMNGLGGMLSAAGRYDQALGMYRRAHEIRPDDPALRTNLGIAEMYAGDIDRAVQLFSRLVEETPLSAEAHFNLGVASRQSGRSRDARTHLIRSVELDGDGVGALTELAWLLATERDPALRDGARAVQLAARARELAGGLDATILDTLAAAHAEAGQFEEARSLAAEALELARREQNPALARFIGQRLRGYEQDTPFRE